LPMNGTNGAVSAIKAPANKSMDLL